MSLIDKVNIVNKATRSSAFINFINRVNFINPVNRTKYFILLVLSFQFSSCYTPRYVYSPAAHNVPVFIKKNDSKIAFNYSVNADLRASDDDDINNSGLDLQAAYAVTNHFALQANYVHRTERDRQYGISSISDSGVLRYHRNLTEFGVGYFSPLDVNKQAVFQVFAGVGFGKFSFTDIGRDQSNNHYNYFHQMDVSKIYIQPAFTVRSKKNFAASLSSRFSLLRFHNIQTNYPAYELDLYKLDSIGNRTHVFWEPAIINTFGFKQLPGIQFEFQGGLALLQSRQFIDYRSFNFSAGILFDIPKLVKGKTTAGKN